MSIAPTTDIPVLTAATARLLATVEAMREPEPAEASLLPGWTRGHVLAHLARNADGLANLLDGARTGVPTPMYASMEARERDIETGSKRSLAKHVADLRASAARFDAAVAAMPKAAWSTEVPHRLGAFPASGVVAKRIQEVEYHHVDLGLPHAYAPADWPPDFVRGQLELVSGQFAGHPDLPRLTLVDAVTGDAYETGARPAVGTPELTVHGPGPALLAWLTGRSDGLDLDVAANSVLPALPPLG